MKGSTLGISEVTKLVTPTLRLIQLKYPPTSKEHQFCNQIFQVLKSGLSALSLLSSYEGLGDTTLGRVGKDSKDVLLGKVGMSLSAFAGACVHLKKLRGEPSSTPLFTLEPETIFGDLSMNKIFLDSVGYRCSEICKSLQRASETVLKFCDGHENGKWRAELSNDASCADLKAAAKDTIKRLDGTQVKAAVEKLEKAG